jgi:2-oxoglutarate dehydrogenase E2 component (dihydrolipoamide succinyltransferase)
MPINIVVPEVGESIVDARVVKWLHKPGDQVAAGEALVELETDKVDVEVSAPQAGVLATIAHGDGADVKIGEVLGTIEQGAAASANGGGTPPPGDGAAKAAAPKPAAVTAPAAEPPADKPSSAAPPAAPKSAPTPATTRDEVPATPSARRKAREEGVEIAAVPRSGPRVTAADISRAAAPASAPAPPAATAKPAPPPAPAQAPPAGAADRAPSDRSETRQRMSRRRATIARRLVEAQQTAAMLTTFNEVDMTAVMSLRERHKEPFKQRYGIGLGIASFFVKASIAALREFPRLNAEIQGDEMVLKSYYDIGMAVGAAEGLVVPVLRDADRMSFAAIEAGIRDFAKRAGDGTLTLDDLRGGTFSITNGGVYGSLMSTPILNPPQVGILGLHAIKDRPAAVGGQVVIRPMMYLALTYDHRIVDGSDAVRFLVRVKELVEEPAALLLES